MEHVPNVLVVENQDPLEENNISRINHRCLCQPARKKHPEHIVQWVSHRSPAVCPQAQLGTPTYAAQDFAQN